MPPTSESSSAEQKRCQDPARSEDDWSGRSLGDFRILRRLGRGGMGQVYLAEQTSLKRKVAIKMLRPELAANQTALRRFRAEAEAVAKLNHPNIVQIYGVGERDGVHYMVLEYVEGRNLRDYLNRKGPPDLPVCLSIMRQVALALQQAHDAGFVHRDVKPENILLTKKGEAKVTDFGLTRCFGDEGRPLNLTQSGVTMGTPLYMSPEQVQGHPVDHRSDIYSYGVTCYTLLTGSPPFRGNTQFEVALQHVQSEPPPLAQFRPDLPSELDAMLRRMMAKDPAGRYSSFKEIVREIHRLREAVTSDASGGPSPEFTLSLPPPESAAVTGTSGSASVPFPSTAARRRSWLWGAGLLLGALLLGVLVRLVQYRMTAPEMPPPPVVDTITPVISEEESYLLQGSKLFADPNTADVNKLKGGLEAQIELGLYYFRQRRYDDLENLARELVNRSYKPMPRGGEHPYRAWGRLIQALVGVFRDRPAAAAELSRLLVLRNPNLPATPNNLTVGGVPGTYFDQPELRQLIVEALDRLAMQEPSGRLEKHPHLETLRKPGPPRLLRPRP
ncbi:MAG: serine/threonine protein kinase [Gemmataceae bacterium]|nr:serine/threonine protein kinase [Gemmataceae bacterium]